MDINTYYDSILSDAVSWLENVNDDKFLDDFLAIHETSIGPTVDEFIESIGDFDTYKLFGVNSQSTILTTKSDSYIENHINASYLKKIALLGSNTSKFANIIHGKETNPSQLKTLQVNSMKLSNDSFHLNGHENFYLENIFDEVEDDRLVA